MAISDIQAIDMPYNSDAEQAVLGCVLIDPECMETVMMYIKPEHFYLEQHRAIYSVMVSLYTLGTAIDPLIILEKLISEGVYDEAGGKSYLLQLAQIVPSTANVENYCKIVREKYYVRTLISTAREIIESAAEGSGDANALIDLAEQKIYDIRRGKDVSGPVSIRDVLINDVYDHLHKVTAPNKKDFMGIPTNIGDLDRIITGLNKPDLILIGARPGMGKTSFALTIARNVAVHSRKKVLFFSLEMTSSQLAQRVLASESRVSSVKFRNGDLDGDDWTRIAAATQLLADSPIYFDDTTNITVPEMKARIRRLKDVDLVIIDYLSLMHSAKRVENRVQEVSEITRSLKIMAKDLDIPVIACAQLSRNTEARGKSHRPQVSDLRESGSIEQDADIVLMLYREDYYRTEDDDAEQSRNNIVEVIVAKNRHGSTDTVQLHWIPEFTTFTAFEMERSE